MQEFMNTWDEWYGDVLSQYQWCELEHRGKKVLYVHGRYEVCCGGDPVPTDMIQIIGYLSPEPFIDEDGQREIAELFRQRHNVENISFWTGKLPENGLV